MSEREFIFQVVFAFYEKAKTDVLIGYHFWRIEDFDEHIPRIAAFWEIQLLGATQRKLEGPFDVLRAHVPLSIKRGELGRWLLLFRNSLKEKVSENKEHVALSELWEERLSFFEGIFLRFFGL